MADLRVRPVSEAEWALYRQVRLAALADSPEAFSSTLERENGLDEQAWRRRLGSAATFLAWQDGAPVGTVTGLPPGVAPVPEFPLAWHLVAMWVSPPARRFGAGALLVEAVLDQARTADAPSVMLWVFQANAPARALYKRMGFRETELRDSRPGNPDDTELLMIHEFDSGRPGGSIPPNR